ncbi:uncharacterized protein LOC119837996 [Zerene cesonia]|uniref:uncharacterized protein LOC119837996 n=1 Tax=Zerene cesonia TaxID=33412 RepID=UPI0018E50C0C|nr:uncharacterized protein LOC119837996 [Zerene cesonia]
MKVNISPSLLRQYAVVFVVNLAVLTTGMSLAWPSPMLVKLTDPENSPMDSPLTESEGSWMVALGFLFGGFVNILGGILLDKIGRKACVLLCFVPKLSMSIFLIFATKAWMLIFARTIMLIGDCLVLAVVPVYSSEIASKTNRGSLGTLLQLFSSLGIVITLSVGPFVSYHTFSYILCGTVVVCLIPLIFLPESPYYQYSKGKYDAALKSLTTFRGSEELAIEEIEEYKKSTEDHVEIDKIEMLKNKAFLKSLILCILLFVGSQIVGYNAVTFYLQSILISTNTSVMPEIASVIIGLIQVFASVSVTILTSMFRRKRLLLSSLSGMFLGMMGLGVFFQMNSEVDAVTGFMNYLPIISLILVVFCYSAGIGSLVWPTTTELFEGPTRAFGTSIGLLFCQITIFITTKYFPIMTSAVGPAPTYWFFSVCCIAVAVLIGVFVPETKDKTFREIQNSMGNFVNDAEKVDKDRSVYAGLVYLDVNLTGVGVGMSIAWPSPMLIKLMKEDTQLSRRISDNEATWIVSCGCLLPIIFSHFISWISNKLGRKTTLLGISIIKGCLYMIQIFATELWMLYSIRVISGILDAAILCNLLAYSAEIASKEIRGALGTIQQMSLATGMLVILTVGPYASYLMVNIVFECITLLIIVPLCFVPESPCSLLGRGLKDEALQTLIYLRGSETRAKEEIEEFTVSRQQNKHKISFRDKIFVKVLAIVILLSVGIQSVGYLTVTMYLQIILDATGTSVSSEVVSVIFGVLQLLAGLFTAVVTDRTGRKPILSLTLVGFSLGMAGLGLFFHVKDSGAEINGIINYLPLISVVMIVVCFNAGPGSLINVVSSELLDSPARSFGMSTAITCGLLVAFINLKYFTLVANMIGSAAVFWMFAGISLAYMMFILICVPETKQRSFLEIQKTLGRKEISMAVIEQ